MMKQTKGCIGTIVCVSLLAGLGLLATDRASAAITPVGQLDPSYGSSDPWVIDDDLFVGTNADGSLTVSSGSDISNLSAFLGFAQNVTGTVTITGLGSSWVNSDLLSVGGWGTGDLSIENRALVTADEVQVGGYAPVEGYDTLSDYLDPNAVLPEGTGTITVTGSGRLESDGLSVGFWGDGTLDVNDGGEVISGWAELGVGPNAIGTATVDGASSTWTISDEVVVGAYGEGDLTIANGGQASASEIYVGGARLDLYVDANEPYNPLLLPDGTGTVTVTGAGSLLDVTGEEGLFVGYSGSGTLDVNEGGQVDSKLVIIGAAPDAVGAVTVDGTGSALSVEDDMLIGFWGRGDLTVTNGGQVAVGDGALIGGGDAPGDLDPNMLADFGPVDGTGTATVIGTDSQLDVDGVLQVGYSGEGILDVLNGGQVSSAVGVVGALAAGDGEVTIDGAGSTWSILGGAGEDPNLVAEGDGYVDIANGGQVNVQGNDARLLVADTLTVGSDGTGSTLTISNGGEVIDDFGLISDEVGGAGAATVSGSGSLWTHTGGLGVGVFGQGDLLVEDGGQVTSLESGIAIGTASVGTVEVTGTGSLWENTEELAVGIMGTGTLTISSGGQVTNTDAFIGGLDPDVPNIDVSFILGDTLDGMGTVQVTGAGSRWDNSGDLYVGYTGTGTLDVNDGGVVTSDLGVVGADPNAEGTVRVADSGSQWSMSEALVVGAFGEGDVTVSGGGQIDANEAYVGGFDPDMFEDEDIVDLPVGTGTITVTGTGSQFDISEFLFVGYTGTGTLDVNDGGVVTSQYGAIGADPNSVGTVTVADSGSQWSISEGLAVGGFGQGDLTISSGGQVDANEAYIGGFDPDVLGGDPNDTPLGTGTVTVSGSGSQFNVDDFLYVGYTGTGTLDVNDGGLVTSANAGIGADPCSTGTVTVTGTGSQWTVDEALAVGAFGTGNLIIANGGRVDAEDSFVAGFDPSLFDGVDGDPNGNGQVTVSGTGSVWANSGNLTIGFGGVGEMTVTGGGQVTSTDGAIGAGPTGDGTVTVAGAGSSWTMSDAFSVGGWGTGTLTIAEGGEVTNVDAYIGGFRPSAFGVDPNVVGYDPNGTGTVTVTGTGSQWINSGDLNVGYLGDGMLTISDSGLVDAVDVMVGEYTTGTLTISAGGVMDANTVWIGRAQNLGDGAVTVTGSGSTLDANDIYVGAWGDGELTISDGGQVSNTAALIGSFWSGTGTAKVTGAGSLWELSGALAVGYGGAGSLLVSDGAHVTSGSGMIAANGDSVATATVSGTGSLWDIDGDLYVGGQESQAGGTGVLDVNDGGVVRADEVYIWESGTVTGDGTVSVLTPTTVHNSGTIAPGDDGIGTLTVEGNVVFEPNSVFEVEIGNSSADKLMVDGDVAINGGMVQVRSVGTVVGSREYDIIEADSVTGTFDTLDTALLDFYFSDAGLDYDSSIVTLWIDAMRFDDPNLVQTYNQEQVGGAFQEIAGNGGNDITAALQELPEFSDVRDAYDQLAGRTRPSLAPISVAGTARFMGTISNRLRNPGSVMASTFGGSSLSAKAGPDAGYSSSSSYEISAGGTSFAVGNGSPFLSDSKWGFWAKGYGLFGNRDGSADAPGYDYTTYGVGFGLDYQFTDTLLLGLTGGYSDGDVDYDGSPDNSDLSATHVGVYASVDAGRSYIDSLLTYSDLDYDTQRYVELTDERLEGDFGGYAVSGYFETGFDWRQIQGWQLQPLASFQFSYLDLDSYTETGGDAALGYDDQTYESYIGSLGAKVTKNLLKDSAKSNLIAQFRARWLHEFGDTRSDVNTFFASDPTTVFSIRDSEIARDSAVLGVGLGAQLNANTRLYVDYDTRLNADDTAHLISGGLQYRW